MKIKNNEFLQDLIFDTQFKKYFISKTVFESSSIENINISLEDTITIYETNNITMFNGKYLDEELKEQKNSLDLLNYTLNSLDKELTLIQLKKMHSILKFRTNWSEKFNSSYGNFKKIPNAIGGKSTSQPHEVEKHLELLLSSYQKNLDLINNKTGVFTVNSLDKHKLLLFAQFHIKFEQIHPYLDGNGRIGRMLLIKQCLENNIYPPIISADKNDREEYYSCLKNSDIISLAKLLLNSMKDVKKQHELYQNDPNEFLNNNLIVKENNLEDFEFTLNLDIDIDLDDNF